MDSRASSRGPAGRDRGQRRAATAAVTTTPAITGHRRDATDGRAVGEGGVTAAVGDSVSSSSSRASAIELSRLRGSFSRERRRRRRTGPGVVTGTACHSGSVLSTEASTSEMSSPGNARWPVSIS